MNITGGVPPPSGDRGEREHFCHVTSTASTTPFVCPATSGSLLVLVYQVSCVKCLFNKTRSTISSESSVFVNFVLHTGVLKKTKKLSHETVTFPGELYYGYCLYIKKKPFSPL